MNSNLIIVDQLSALEKDGKISAEELALLQQLISEDKDAMSFYQEKRALATDAEIEHLVSNRNPSTTLLKIWDDIQAKKRRIVVIKRVLSVAAAAIVVSMVMVAVRYLPANKNNGVAKNEVKNKNAIELTLPNGEKVDLSSRQGQMKIGNTTINNNNKSLSYSATGNENSAISTLLVPIGKDYQIELSDGTKVFLNSATSLQFPLVFMNTREITINGEAYLQIASDASKPFIVHLPNMDVRVLGTEFNVNTYDKGEDKVALVNGAVNLTGRSEASISKQGKILKPGQQAVLNGKELEVSSFDPDYALSWRRGYFRFKDIPLSKVCEVIPRWFGIEVKMDNPNIADMQFSGALYRNTPLRDQLSRFEIDGQVSYYWEGDVLHFK